jgi:hypothetical protein
MIDIPVVMAIKFPATVIVLGIVSNEGDIMPPHLFPKGLKSTPKNTSGSNKG